ncbi:hypothetical protein LJR039_006805 [Pseudorhodoferax sp. LjRoot39]|uniref:RIFT barrel domain-containing protein n=1 Tax=Pseudorhodoferax sp. LjRoot39 TaxID=3342328 RepID=UPI003ECFF8FD
MAMDSLGLGFGLALVCSAAVGIGVLLVVAKSRRAPSAMPTGGRRGLMLWLLLPAWLGRAVAAPSPSKTTVPPGKRLCVVRLHNTHAERQQVAHFVTPMFGQAFRQGDMPAGERPRFTLADGTDCPATLWGITSWPDGSMKFCGAIVRVPTPVAAGAGLELEVRAGGSAERQVSKRTTTDLESAELSVVLEGLVALEGTWTAALNDGIHSRANIVQLAAGPAGALWRIGSEFRNRAGKPHGQLYCWHYVLALTGANDEFTGLRYLARIAQPWTDVEQPKAEHREFSASLRAGAQVLRKLLGHTTTETPGDAIRLPHYASFFSAGHDGRWDYVQGTGKSPADAHVRVTLDGENLRRSGLVPPYDPEALINDAERIDYHPMGRGSINRAMGTTGERSDIGLLPEWNVRHLLKQSEDHERVVRVNGLSAAGFRLTFRKRATLQPVPCVDIRAQYPGLGNAETNWRGYIYMSGMTKPAPNESLWREDTAHRPGCTYWPYLFTGEPQYLDLLTEHAFAHVLELNQGNGTVWGTTFPRQQLLEGAWGGERGIRVGAGGTLYKGSGVLLYGIGGQRMAAWRSRDVAQAAALAPDMPPDGAAVRQYLNDVLASSYAAFRDYMSKVPASFREAGLFMQDKGNGLPWQIAYMSWSVCHQADILGTPDAAYVRSHLGRFWNGFARQADMACLVAMACSYRDEDGNLVDNINGVLGSLRCNLNFDAASSRITIAPAKDKTNGAWSAHDGDRFSFAGKPMDLLKSFAEMKPYRVFFAVRCEGQTFQLALKPNGPPIRFPESVVITDCFAQLKDFRPDLAFSPPNSPSGYSANIRGAVAYHLACGDKVNDAVEQLDRIVKGQRINYKDRPKYRTLTSRT